MRVKTLFLSILLFVNLLPAFTQVNNVTVSGLITDKSSSEALPYVNITVTTVDGHNFKQLIKALEKAKQSD